MNASSRSRSSLQRSVSSNSISPTENTSLSAPMELADRNVVITGAGSGIGRALARRVAAESPRAIVVADIDLPSAEAVAEELGGLAVRTDVSREQEIVELARQAREFGGPIDLLSTNAGVPAPPAGPEASDDGWPRTSGVNVIAHAW